MELYLQKFGAQLRVKDGLFQVTVPDITGANNHLVEQFAAHQVKSILLHKGTSISSDALLLALSKGVDIMIIDHFGNPEGRLYPNKPNGTIALWKAQLQLSDTDKGLQIARFWIAQKIEARLDHLRKLKPYRNAYVEKVAIIEKAETTIKALLHKVKEHPTAQPVENAASLRGFEGTAGRTYFDTLIALIPDEYRCGGRSFRPADDIFNAFLNYGYGILYSKVETALHLAGLSPYIGFMHSDGHKRKSLVFDFIEPFRIWVDKEVFKLFTRKIAQPRHGYIHKDKGLWLNDEGKQIITIALLERFKENITDTQGKIHTFESILTDAARHLVSKILRGGDKPPSLLNSN